MRMQRSSLQAAAVALAVAAAPATAADAAPQMGRYLPFYPGLYLNAAYTSDDQDRVFDQSGNEHETAVPSIGGVTRFPQRTLQTQFAWYFPMFEAYDWFFFSDRIHTARVTLRHVDVRTEGALSAFISDTSDDASTEADDLRNNGGGIGDLSFEFGSFLWGSQDWRTRERTPFALLALVGLDLPIGNYDRDAPVSAGSNTAAFHARLALHAQPWRGAFIDAAGGYREYFKNQDAAFGGLAPTQQGDDLFWDASLAQRLFGGVYLSVFASGREGDPNIYENPRFAPNAPEPPMTVPPSDNFPTPGRYMDDGTALTTAGVSLSYFITQRWLAGVSYTRALSGESGKFDLPFTNRQPAGCTVGSAGCETSEGETVHVDGMGPARSYANDRITLTLSYNFGQGDAFTCTGCKQ